MHMCKKYIFFFNFTCIRSVFTGKTEEHEPRCFTCNCSMSKEGKSNGCRCDRQKKVQLQISQPLIITKQLSAMDKARRKKCEIIK